MLSQTDRHTDRPSDRRTDNSLFSDRNDHNNPSFSLCYPPTMFTSLDFSCFLYPYNPVTLRFLEQYKNFLKCVWLILERFYQIEKYKKNASLLTFLHTCLASKRLYCHKLYRGASLSLPLTFFFCQQAPVLP